MNSMQNMYRRLVLRIFEWISNYVSTKTVFSCFSCSITILNTTKRSWKDFDVLDSLFQGSCVKRNSFSWKKSLCSSPFETTQLKRWKVRMKRMSYTRLCKIIWILLFASWLQVVYVSSSCQRFDLFVFYLVPFQNRIFRIYLGNSSFER